jgi:hypothetical protein
MAEFRTEVIFGGGNYLAGQKGKSGVLLRFPWEEWEAFLGWQVVRHGKELTVGYTIYRRAQARHSPNHMPPVTTSSRQVLPLKVSSATSTGTFWNSATSWGPSLHHRAYGGHFIVTQQQCLCLSGRKHNWLMSNIWDLFSCWNTSDQRGMFKSCHKIQMLKT